MGVFLCTLYYSTLTNSYKFLILKSRGKGEAQADTHKETIRMSKFYIRHVEHGKDERVVSTHKNQDLATKRLTNMQK